MPFEANDNRINRNGRPKGAKNRTTEQLRAMLKDIVENNLHTIEQDLQLLEPKERFNVLNQLLKHVLPAPIVDISQFTDSDLDILLQRLKEKKYHEQSIKN